MAVNDIEILREDKSIAPISALGKQDIAR